MEFALSLLASFLVGGIPFGFLAVLLIYRKDVRTLGSGNIGATNVCRCFPKRWRLLAFLVIYAFDFAKGYLPVLLLSGTHPSHPELAGALLGLLAILGHCFSPFLGFKGGKGVATSCGALFGLEPLALGIGLLVFFVVFLTTKVVAIGSISLAASLALAIILREPGSAFGARLPVTLLGLFLALFIVWTHRENIRGLLRLRNSRSSPGEN